MPSSTETLFQSANAVAACAWFALVLSPASARWTRAVRSVAGRALPLAFAATYVVLVVVYWPADGGFDSLAAVRRLFEVPELLVAGWLHYLAFDLFVGAWIAERAAELRMPHALIVPLLALCFLLGPAGLLAFALARPVVVPRDASARRAAS